MVNGLPYLEAAAIGAFAMLLVLRIVFGGRIFIDTFFGPEDDEEKKA